MQEHTSDPTRRVAQHMLAFEVCDFVHGQEVAQATRAEHSELRAPTLTTLMKMHEKTVQADAASIVAGPPHARSSPSSLSRGDLQKSISRVLVILQLVKTTGEANRLIASGGVYAGMRIGQHECALTKDEPLAFQAIEDANRSAGHYVVDGGELLILRRGKWDVRCVRVIDDS